MALSLQVKWLVMSLMITHSSANWSSRESNTSFPSKGTESTSTRGLTVGGKPTLPGRFPYFVRLYLDGEFVCGATLIRKDFLLTAAQCTMHGDGQLLTATVNTARDSANSTSNSAEARVVKKIAQNQIYDGATLANDVVLLQIDPFDIDVPTILLNDDHTIPVARQFVASIGVGVLDVKLEENQAGSPQIMELKVVDNAECDSIFPSELHRKSLLCIKQEGAGQDGCDGSAGSPLIILGDTVEEDVQVGVVSYLDERRNNELPGVNADVSYLYKWIESTLCEHSAFSSPDCINTTKSNENDCQDHPGSFYADYWHSFQRCQWLLEGTSTRAEQYCHDGNEAWLQCPVTCNSCSNEANGFGKLYRADEVTLKWSASVAFSLATILLFLVVSGLAFIRLLLLQHQKTSFHRDDDQTTASDTETMIEANGGRSFVDATADVHIHCDLAFSSIDGYPCSTIREISNQNPSCLGESQ